MRIRLSVSNFRCFPACRPAEFEIGTGVTAFIGENNAGKSAAMRVVHDLRPLFDAAAAPAGLRGFLQSHRGVALGTEVRDPDEIHFAGVEGPIRLTVEASASGEADGASNLQLVFTKEPDTEWTAAWSNDQRGLLIDDAAKLYSPSEPDKTIGDANITMEALRALARSVYIPASRHALNGDTKSFDLSVGARLNAGFDALQSGFQKGKNALAVTIEESLGRLFGISHLRLTPTQGTSDGRQVRVPDLGQFRFDEIGTGFAQAFAALYTVVTMKPSIVFIDEPELSLHPRLQFHFLAELQRFASMGLVFTTHNLGLAMNSAERVYAVTRQPGIPATRGRQWSSITPWTEAPSLPALLGTLSYPSYGQPATRQILLVEGPTDLRILQVLLFKLGIADEVVAMHLGGSTTIQGSANAKEQLAGVHRLCKRTWCLIDSESTSPGVIGEARRAFLGVCKEVGIEAHATARRSLENYLSDTACKGRFGRQARSLEPFERLGDSKVGWSKAQSWLAAAMMDPTEFSDVYGFLTRIVGAVNQHRSGQQQGHR